MKKLAFMSAVVAVAAAQSYATTWYVDAENGSNAYDGKADAAHADPGLNIGPKKTLGVFTSLVSSGDTIYVAPGWYSNEVSTTASNFRFYTSVGNISLISTGCATNTFIVGAADPSVNQDTSPFGCGSGAIVPVKMLGNNNTIKGITIANGRQVNWSAYGGGVVFEASKTGNSMIDCVVTNCVANRGGGVCYLNYALRCLFTGNYAVEGSHALLLSNAANCIFENTDGYAVYNNSDGGTFLNCLCRGNKAGNFRTGTGPINVYNSVFLKGSSSDPKNKKCYFSNCFFDYNPMLQSLSAEAITGTNEECRVFSLGSLKFNADGSPMKGNPVIDAAKASYYDNNFPSAFDSSEKPFDILGNARTVGDAMDIGAVERGASTIDDNEWFVDAESGDDANSGKTPALAKKTLTAIMEGRVAGNVVYAAPGVYSNGTVTVGSQMFRAKIPAGVSLVGTEGAENTVILGEASSAPDSDYGTGPGAVACVYMSESSASSSVVGLSGFTLSCGHGAVKTGSEATTTRGSAVYGSSRTAGIIADCVITNCATARGPVFHVGAVVRCRFYDNVSIDGAGGSVLDVNCIYDSYFRHSLSGYSKKYLHDIYQTGSPTASSGFVMNCTFESDGNGGPHTATGPNVYVYNSIVKTSSDEGGAEYYDCVTTTSPGTQGSYVHGATVVTNRDAVALTVESYRPAAGANPAAGAGNYVYYTNLVPAAVADVVGKDLWGNPRLVNGVLDIGAVACDRPAAKANDTSTGLTLTGIAKDGFWHDAEAGASYSFSRNYTSAKLLRGVYLNGEYIDFNAHEDGWTYEGTMPALGSVEIVPVYPAVNDWYVDAVNGSDANDGLRPGAAHAFKTLAHASTNALMEAGATVYVAEGVYNEGVVPPALGVDSTDSRMMVKYKINFVASGRREATIIEGASSKNSDSGIGEGAVRCCLMRGGSLRGFTLRNGNVNVGSTAEDDKGGGIRCSSSEAYAYDCEIHHCNAVRGGGAQGVRLVRCYLHDNTNNTTGVEPARSFAGTGAFACSGYNTVVEGDCYTGATWLNCTLTGKCWGAGTTFYNCYIGADGSAGSGVAATFTNCVCAGSIASHSLHDGCIENRPCRFDRSNWRPRSRSSAVFDAGDYSLYTSHFPADLSAYAELDYAGGPRVREGGLDIGAGEMEYVQTGVMIIVK